MFLLISAACIRVIACTNHCHFIEGNKVSVLLKPSYCRTISQSLWLRGYDSYLWVILGNAFTTPQDCDIILIHLQNHFWITFSGAQVIFNSRKLSKIFFCSICNIIKSKLHSRVDGLQMDQTNVFITWSNLLMDQKRTRTKFNFRV